jgi:hypothetical protein
VLAAVAAVLLARGFAPAPSLRLVDSTPRNAAAGLVSASFDRRLGFVTVTGTMANRTHHPLVDVEEIVELLDDDSRTVRMESGMIAFRRVEAGSTSPFRVELPDIAGATGVRVRFRRLEGEGLD